MRSKGQCSQMELVYEGHDCGRKVKNLSPTQGQELIPKVKNLSFGKDHKNYPHTHC